MGHPREKAETMRNDGLAKVNAETGELLNRELTEEEVMAQEEWLREMARNRARLHQHYHPTDWAKDDTPGEWRKFLGGYDLEKRCEHCFLLLPKSGCCDCRE